MEKNIRAITPQTSSFRSWFGKLSGTLLKRNFSLYFGQHLWHQWIWSQFRYTIAHIQGYNLFYNCFNFSSSTGLSINSMNVLNSNVWQCSDSGVKIPQTTLSPLNQPNQPLKTKRSSHICNQFLFTLKILKILLSRTITFKLPRTLAYTLHKS